MSEAVTTFRYSEARFAEMIGLSRGDAKYLRDQKLTQDKHWRREHGEIALNISGVKRIWACLEKKPCVLELSACEFLNGSRKKIIALPPLNAPRTMRVTQVPLNTAILHARDALGQDYVVRRGCGSFHVGVEIEAQPDGMAGFWRIVGPVPRFAGDRGYKPLSVLEKK